MLIIRSLLVASQSFCESQAQMATDPARITKRAMALKKSAQ
jgi:hypothetical protein